MKKRVKHPKLGHPLDIALGSRIKAVRTAQHPRVSQQWLARECGCTTQQIMKYECGQNRVSFSRLCEIANALDLTVLELIAPLVSRSALTNGAPSHVSRQNHESSQ